MYTDKLLHFFAVALAVSIPAIFTGLGQAIAVSGFLEGANRQPNAATKLTKLLLYGLLAVELPFLLSFITAILIFIKPMGLISNQVELAEFGAALGLTISASCVGLAAGYTVKFASNALARLPQHDSKIMAFFVILLAAIETPSLFSFITAMLIFAQLNPNMSVNQSYKLFSAAITMGLGSVGPSLAQWLFAQKVWKAISYRFFNFPKISPSSLLTEALIESGALFSFMVSILLVMKRVNPAFDVIYVKYIFLAISLCISLGCFASAIGIGYVGSVAIKEMAIHHDSQELIFKNSAFAQVLIETCSLFAFLISLVLLSQVTVF